jgi:hypothetical protein
MFFSISTSLILSYTLDRLDCGLLEGGMNMVP